MSGSRFSASTVISTSATIDRLSIDLDLFPRLLSTNSLSLFIFCPEDEIIVLLVLIPSPVKRAALLLDLLRLLVLEYVRLDSTLPSTQEALLESFLGALNFMPLWECAMVSRFPSIVIYL